jgi:hypothetical protein
MVPSVALFIITARNFGHFHDNQEESNTKRLFILDLEDENKNKAIAEA